MRKSWKKWNQLPIKLRQQIFWFGLVFVIFVVYAIWDVTTTGPLTELFNNREEMIQFVQDKKVLAPLAYIALQILQTVIAPIPGGAIGPLGGFLFGWWGVLWTTIGATIGATFVFWISKIFGRDLILKALNQDEFEKFDLIPDKKAEMVIFALFLIPGLPDDTICYLAGLTKVRVERLVISFMIGRLPAVVVANYLGMGLGEGNLPKVFILLGIIALILGFVAIEKDNILKFFRSERKKYKKKD